MQRRIVFLRFLFCLLPLGAACSHNSALTGPSTPSSTPTAGPSTLAGQVVDQSTKQAIASATLTLVDPAGVVATTTTVSDGAGKFAFANVAAGTYSLQTAATGYSASNATISVPVGAFTVQMLRAGVQPSLPLEVAIAGPSTIAVGQSIQLTANLVYTDGTRKDVTNVTKWASTTASAAVSTSGVLTGYTAGGTVITASVENVQGSLPVTVVAR
jgi:hypothetical protein